jgi:hypothetical protein
MFQKGKPGDETGLLKDDPLYCGAARAPSYLGIVSRGAVSPLVAPSPCALPLTPVPPWSSEFELGSYRHVPLLLRRQRSNTLGGQAVGCAAKLPAPIAVDRGIDGVTLTRIAEGIQADARRALHEIIKRGCRNVHAGSPWPRRGAQRAWNFAVSSFNLIPCQTSEPAHFRQSAHVDPKTLSLRGDSGWSSLQISFQHFGTKPRFLLRPTTQFSLNPNPFLACFF